jgi:ligand-binding SRPBCC domain-containing protein
MTFFKKVVFVLLYQRLYPAYNNIYPHVNTMLFQLHRKITLKTSIEEAWNFFSDPRNLKVIKPPKLNMTITSDLPSSMYEGMIISYKVHPILNIPLTWVTEITKIIPNQMFIDEQRHGPYKVWHHEHFFREVENGTEVEDLVSYVMPFGPLGILIQKLHVSGELERIFNYRTNILEERFR